MTERMNMLRVAVPEQATEVGFDVERDVSPAQWEEIEDGMKEMQRTTHWGKLAYSLTAMKLLRPDYETELKRRDAVHFYDAGISTRTVTEPVISAYVLASKLNNLAEFEFNESDKQTLLKMFHRSILNPPVLNAGVSVYSLITLLMLGTPLEEFKPEHIEAIHTMTTLNLANKDYDGFARDAAALRLLGQDIEVTDDQWTHIKEALANEKDVGERLSIMLWMKILAAGEVKVTQEGIETTPPLRKPQEEVAPQPALPEV